MGVFDSPSDAPFQLKTEGQTIVVNFLQGKPAAGQGTIQWNIPPPASGCQSAGEGRGAYCGFVVTVSSQVIQPNQAPQDGIVYKADPTVDPDLHVGDKINGAMVVGAFYEKEKKANGLPLTTSFVVNDLKPDTQYFVAGYAVDCQYRYHAEGVRAYSDQWGSKKEPDTPAFQNIGIDGGVLPTDGTGLTPGFLYQFELVMDPTTPQGPGSDRRVLKFTANGTDITTYQQLIDKINQSISLVDNPPISPVPPHTGGYYWDNVNHELYQWNGTTHLPIDTLYEPTDPSTPQVGDYWYDTLTGVFSRWGVPNPGIWNVVDKISYPTDPQVSHGQYWYDGLAAYQRCGDLWCEVPSYEQTTDPSLPPPKPDCNLYWYDENTQQLKHWDSELCVWVVVYAVSWSTAPNNPAVGSYWMNSTTEVLNQWDGTQWNVVDITYNRRTPPPLPLQNTDIWYNPETEQLFTRDFANTKWEEQDALVWPTDPTDVESCGLWWNTADDKLYKWDSIGLQWVEITTFFQSTTEPYQPPVLEVGTLWFNPTVVSPLRWDGSQWKEVPVIVYPSDPTLMTSGMVWHNTTTDQWFVWGDPTPGTWSVVDPIASSTNPFTIPSGTMWFDSSTNGLYQRVGLSWVSVPYSSQPFTPNTGDKWYDNTESVLKEWKNGQWIVSPPLATASLTPEGNIRFVSTYTGSGAGIKVLIPSGSKSGIAPGDIATGTAGMDWFYAEPERVQYPLTTVGLDTFLFDYLTPSAHIGPVNYGTDGLSGLPSYAEPGVGTDGSPDERRNLIREVRAQLGYPTINVELTAEQLDTAVSLAIAELRSRSSNAYKRGFFFLNTTGGYQHYKLTNKTVGYNKIVSVLGAYRFTSAFLSTSYGSGVYGQIVLQHLYNMGTFDLLSYHLVSDYIEQLEQLFATRLVFTWDEANRTLNFHHSFTAPEKVLLDVVIERTEQELLKDRWTQLWINRYAYAESLRMLSQIRGKYSTLPGAGGGVTLNAADLMTQHNEIKEMLYAQIDDYIVNDVENIGINSTFTIG